MMMSKTLSARIVAPLLLASALPASAQVIFETSSHKVYRQDKKAITFTGGSFVANMNDGSFSYIGGCSWVRYYSPGYFIGLCSEGTTGLISDGKYEALDILYPYLLITNIQPATVIANRKEGKVRLTSAPASTLPRPSGGFKDNSLAAYYNLHTSSVREYVLTEYNMQRSYNGKQRSRFESDIVPGVYHYSFPRLNNPDRPSPVISTIYPMAEGRAKKNNKTTGFEFTQVNKSKFTKEGFVEFGYRIPNVINWRALPRTTVFSGTDTLNFSLRELRNRNRPKSASVRGRSIYPPYVNGRDPRVRLPSPFQTSFTIPPLLDSGTRGVIEVELQRRFQTGGVTYDYSTRRFQMPFEVRDRYTEYKQLIFGAKKKGTKLMQDADNDGYNNMVEWILDSDASDRGSIPGRPVPSLVEQGLDPFFLEPTVRYFGFNVDLKVGTFPKVDYTLQVSKDNGATWNTFESGDDWYVRRYTRYLNGATKTQIQVRSVVEDEDGNLTHTLPPTAVGDVYRVKVTRAK